MSKIYSMQDTDIWTTVQFLKIEFTNKILLKCHKYIQCKILIYIYITKYYFLQCSLLYSQVAFFDFLSTSPDGSYL